MRTNNYHQLTPIKPEWQPDVLTCQQGIWSVFVTLVSILSGQHSAVLQEKKISVLARPVPFLVEEQVLAVKTGIWIALSLAFCCISPHVLVFYRSQRCQWSVYEETSQTGLRSYQFRPSTSSKNDCDNAQNICLLWVKFCNMPDWWSWLPVQAKCLSGNCS